MARPDTQTQLAVRMIRERIMHGDHLTQGMPGERGLALELGLSRQTVRRAIQLLTDEGLLVRGPTGRLQIAKDGSHGTRPPIAFLHSGQLTTEGMLWRDAVCTTAEARGATVRTLGYEHYGDATISSALDNYTGVFLLPRAEESVPAWLARRALSAETRLVVLDQDESAAGLRSVIVFPSLAGRKLLVHLHERGHRRIDCLNVQPENPVIQRRIAVWRDFLALTGLQGELHSMTGPGTSAAGHQLMMHLLAARSFASTALYCTTAQAAIGAARALHESGRTVGRDVSICAVNDEGMGPYLVPSLTSLQTPPRARYLEKAIAWIITGKGWSKPTLHQADDAPLFVGESTGPAPARRSI